MILTDQCPLVPTGTTEVVLADEMRVRLMMSVAASMLEPVESAPHSACAGLKPLKEPRVPEGSLLPLDLLPRNRGRVPAALAGGAVPGLSGPR